MSALCCRLILTIWWSACESRHIRSHCSIRTPRTGTAHPGGLIFRGSSPSWSWQLLTCRRQSHVRHLQTEFICYSYWSCQEFNWHSCNRQSPRLCLKDLIVNCCLSFASFGMEFPYALTESFLRVTYLFFMEQIVVRQVKKFTGFYGT
jgi:hypothetical protein